MLQASTVLTKETRISLMYSDGVSSEDVERVENEANRTVLFIAVAITLSPVLRFVENFYRAAY